MKNSFDQIFLREFAKQRENRFHVTVCGVMGVLGLPLAIFVHPLWLIASGLAGLFYWFHQTMHGGERDLTTPAARKACEFMLSVREHGRAREMLPLAATRTIFQLGYMESFEGGGAGGVIAQNLEFGCAHCERRADRAVAQRWLAARKAFKKFPEQETYLRLDGTCAQCGNVEGWFESRLA